MNYTLLLAGDVPTAGLMTLPKEACDAGAKPGWTGYVGVDDVDAYAGRVTKAGGSDCMYHLPTFPMSDALPWSPIPRAQCSACSKACRKCRDRSPTQTSPV